VSWGGGVLAVGSVLGKKDKVPFGKTLPVVAAGVQQIGTAAVIAMECFSGAVLTTAAASDEHRGCCVSTACGPGCQCVVTQACQRSAA